MEYLFSSWETLAGEIGSAPHMLLLSDYDGTLTPIVGRPKDALLAPGVREKLNALAEKTNYTVGIISGRSMSELESMVSITGIYYAGNHGLEIEGPGLNFISEQADIAGATIKEVAGKLATALAEISGVIIEDKGLSLSVHYRLVKEDEVSTVADIFSRETQPLLEDGRIKVTSGKKIMEVRPPIDWHKGKAVETISREIKSQLKLERMLTIYLGDDLTDEDAFKVLHRPDGLSVYIGRNNPSSSAEYYLDSTAEVEELLRRLIELK